MVKEMEKNKVWVCNVPYTGTINSVRMMVASLGQDVEVIYEPPLAGDNEFIRIAIDHALVVQVGLFALKQLAGDAIGEAGKWLGRKLLNAAKEAWSRVLTDLSTVAEANASVFVENLIDETYEGCSIDGPISYRCQHGTDEERKKYEILLRLALIAEPTLASAANDAD